MGRHQKKGLDYFPLDVYMDDSVALLEVDHGLEGFAILIKLYQKIYANGYYIHVSDKELKLLSRNINVDINQLNAIINSAIGYHIFDKCIHKKYQILTSSGIQQRYLFAVERRISINFIKEILLLEENVYINMKNVYIKKIDVAENGINVYSGTHIKLKNSKLKNIKKEESNKPYFYLSELLYSLHKEEDTDYTKSIPQIHKWADDIRKLETIDKRSKEDIESVIRWCQEPGCFWFPNIISGKKLREKFDTIISQMKRDPKNKLSGNGQKKKDYSEGW